LTQESSTVLGKGEIFISIVLPCYNEGIHLPISLESLSQFLNSLNKEYEIIVSDDGSNDTTPNLDWQKYSSDFYVKYMPSNYGGPQCQDSNGAKIRQHSTIREYPYYVPR
jgi:cellulose synthase/poly-beta-1,6-N-acetylglucosamine synthase-like glycosyltransferase